MIKNILKKTAVAAAVSVVISAPVLADGYDVTLKTDTVILVEEIFGINADESNGESDLTLVTMPTVNVDLGDDDTGDMFGDGETSTIQFILGGDAQWGDDISTTQLLACSNGGTGGILGTLAAGTLVPATDCAGVANTLATTEIEYRVTQGGANTDNTVTIEFTAGAEDLELLSFDFAGQKVKNLTNQLSSASAHSVMFSSEYNAAPSEDALDISENDAPVKIFGSKSSITLTTDILTSDEMRRISVAADQLLFTDVIPGITDFDETNDVEYVGIGSFQADITTILEADIDTSGPQTVIGEDIKGEDGLDFEYAGGDVHGLVLSGGNFNAYATTAGSIFLADLSAANEDKCNLGGSGVISDPTDVLSGGATATVVGSMDATGTATFPLEGNTVALTTEYDICFEADQATTIDEEALALNITYTVDYFNARYDEVDESGGPYGPIQRNGCIASFFNIPAADNNDTAYVRLTNTSDGSTGGVTGVLFAQNGSEVASGFDMMDGGTLAPHETAVFWSGEGDVTTEQGRTIYSIPDAAGVASGNSAVAYVGRARLVASGAFPICEALGLLRTGDGSLFNMTATTQGNNLKLGQDRGNNAN